MPITIAPINVEIIIRALPTPVKRRIAAPINMASVDVYPMDPAMVPKNMSETSGKLLIFPAAASAKGVAPE